MSRATTVALILLICGCEQDNTEVPREFVQSPARPGISFTDITTSTGIRFTHYNNSSSRKLLPETMGSGCAFFDYDGDGRPDLYLANGTGRDAQGMPGAHGVLYRNRDGQRFDDVTRAAHLDQPMNGMGVAVSDIDNDGRLDLFISGVDGDRMYRNGPDGRFQDITEHAGLHDPGFSSSSAFLDFDRDGRIDLVVGRYVTWSAATDVGCRLDGQRPTYCTPERYPPATSRLYRNVGGRFDDVTAAAGLTVEGKTLGVAVLDHDRDGWPDLVFANDTTRNLLYVNNRQGGFSEVGVTAQIAYSESGATRGGMGITAGDADGDGLDDVAIGNFAMEMAAFYRNSSAGLYLDDAAQVGIGLATLRTLAFATLFIDLDSDGWLDLVFVNGHIEPSIAELRKDQSYAQVTQVFRNDGLGSFTEISPAPGDVLARPLVGRGLCAADIDGDGDEDLAITQNGGPVVVLRNDATPRHWLRIRPIGRKSNRAGLDVTARAVVGTRVLTRSVRSGGSYLSASEPILSFGLGDAERVDRLEVSWPSGTQQTLTDVAVDQTLTLEEPSEPEL